MNRKKKEPSWREKRRTDGKQAIGEDKGGREGLILSKSNGVAKI